MRSQILVGFLYHNYLFSKPQTNLGICRSRRLALQCLCFWGETIKQLPMLVMVPKISLSPPLMQLPELKQAVTCTKNSGCRLHEQRLSEFAYETPIIFPANIAAPSYPWPINFLRSSCFCCKKDCKASVIVPASVEQT